MMKKAGRLLAGMLPVFLILSGAFFSGCTKQEQPRDETTAAQSAGKGQGMVLSMSDATVTTAEDMFTVEISVSGNPGVAVLILSVVPDEKLTVLGAVNEPGFFHDLDTGSPASGFNLVFSSDNDVTGDGVIARVTINCAGVPAGTYPIRLVYRDSCDESLSEVAPGGAAKNAVIATATLTVTE